MEKKYLETRSRKISLKKFADSEAFLELWFADLRPSFGWRWFTADADRFIHQLQFFFNVLEFVSWCRCCRCLTRNDSEEGKEVKAGKFASWKFFQENSLFFNFPFKINFYSNFWCWWRWLPSSAFASTCVEGEDVWRCKYLFVINVFIQIALKLIWI